MNRRTLLAAMAGLPFLGWLKPQGEPGLPFVLEKGATYRWSDVERGIVSVPRLFTLWQGDEAEQAWQRSIQEALPGALIDVANWTPAADYPQGDMGEPTNGQ